LHGKPNDLIDRLKADPACENIDIDALLNPATFVGRAPQQTNEFLAGEVNPIREKHKNQLGKINDLNI
ncbi:MAG: adenylosuccinate lyase, partial [Phycisphaerae bacterium]|nr:adenylosuccinate lyase [Phycisphaerae bacterium]